MSERAIFLTALEHEDLAERLAYLHQACAGDDPLRQRIEALLQSHEQAGAFLDKPALLRAVEELEGQQRPGDTPSDAAAGSVHAPSLDFLRPSEQPDSLGRLSHYEVLEVIGKGGMSVVVRALDVKLQRVVAIKVLAPHLAADPSARKRFVREAQAAAAICHEHVVNIHAVEEADGLPFLVMEYVSGISLQDRIDRRGPLEVKEILRIGMQAAQGLAAAHAQGLIHRDIKPANILLENGVERVKITDFGLARAADDAAVTQSGIVAGTPNFMSPEQARGDPLDQRTDLFSLGSVLYVLCTGRLPFRAEGAMAVLKRVCDEAPRPIPEINAEIPPWLADVIARLQAKDPAERFQSAAAVADLLGQQLAYLQHPGCNPVASAVMQASNRHFHRPTLRLALGAGILLTMAGAGYVYGPSVYRFTTNQSRPVTKIDASAGEAVPTAVQPNALEKPFVVVSSGSQTEQCFADLKESVAAAQEGDAIEIRGNGPFITPNIQVPARLLTIRAAAGFAPVLQLSPQAIQAGVPLIQRNGVLVLEGLEFQRLALADFHPNQIKCLIAGGGRIYACNCRFALAGEQNMEVICARPCLDLKLCNCQFTGQVAHAIVCLLAPGGKLHVENCLIDGETGLIIDRQRPERRAPVRLAHNTFVNLQPIAFQFQAQAAPVDPAQSPMLVEATANVFDGGDVLTLTIFPQDRGTKLQHDQERARLRQQVSWRDRRNLYSAGTNFLRINNAYDSSDTSVLSQLSDWKQFWAPFAHDSLEGALRYQGFAKTFGKLPKEAPSTAQAFRLHPDSAGKGAGEGGRDLGADVDLVGPGPAYERWKKTPAYLQWLKDSGQQK